MEDKVQIFSTSDARIKSLGKMLNSGSSMDILQLLNNAEMTANEIAEKTGMSLPLVIHHLNKMSQAGIVNIVRTRLNSKNQPMKYYTAVKTGILILPELAFKKAKESKSLSKSLRRIMRFSAIGTAGLVSWMLTKPDVETPTQTPPSESDNAVIDESEDPTSSLVPTDENGIKQFFEFFWAGSGNADALLVPIIISVMVVAMGIGLNIVLSGLFKKNRRVKM